MGKAQAECGLAQQQLSAKSDCVVIPICLLNRSSHSSLVALDQSSISCFELITGRGAGLGMSRFCVLLMGCSQPPFLHGWADCTRIQQ